jgi:hypothetical protein
LPPGVFLWSENMTDAEILTLVQKLEQCRLAPSDFHHRDHLAVSVAYLYAADLEGALDRMRGSLLRFISHHGRKGYHETITRFWMQEVEKRLDRGLCLRESVRRIQARLNDKNLVYQYYSKETLNSPEAKERWVEPDQNLGC